MSVPTDDHSLLDFVVGAPLRIAVILVAAAVVNRLARRGVKRGLAKLGHGGLRERLGGRPLLADTDEITPRSAQRVQALSTVLRSVVSFVIWIVAGFMVLDQIGINLGPLLAGAGILGVAIGFGSQSLVKDFLAGIFILVEDQFGVGDTVDLGEAVGVVEVVSLRTTRLRAVDGTVWHVPNGEIARVGNKSQHWSRALLDIQVAYTTDLEEARRVIKDVADAIWEENPETILEEPELWGVENLGAHGIDIRLVVKTRPSEQWNVSRLIRERIKAEFDNRGIEIPFPQQTVWMRVDEQAQRALAGTGD
ncbi:MAG TPA: mechanosensitive ion channel family protein [Thermoleophilaceae bacterium]|nr:mechanosensitive ion channel family protein [Thermoleophilaceae bacterium]